MIKPITFSGASEKSNLSPIKVPSFKGKTIKFSPAMEQNIENLGNKVADLYSSAYVGIQKMTQRVRENAPIVAKKIKTGTSACLKKTGEIFGKLAGKIK